MAKTIKDIIKTGFDNRKARKKGKKDYGIKIKGRKDLNEFIHAGYENVDHGPTYKSDLPEEWK